MGEGDVVGRAFYELATRDDQLDAGLRQAEQKVQAAGKVAAEGFARPMDQAAGRVRESIGKVAGAINSLSGRSPQELAAQLAKAADAADEARAALQALARADALNPAKARAYADALDEIGIEADQTIAELRQLQASDPRFNTAELTRAADQVDRVGREAREAAGGLNAMKGVRADTHLERVSQEAREAAVNLDRTQQGAGKLSERFMQIRGALVALGIGLGVTQVLRFFGGAISAASDLNEEVDKAGVVFGASAGKVEDFAERADHALGLSKQQALAAAGGYGNMFRTIGFADEAAADMSITMVQLAADMASFNNQDPSDMLLRLRSGLSGEAEPLRQFGVLLSEARVKEEAYAVGIAMVGKELTEAQKVQARYSLILKDTALQQGNFADTADSLANRQREQAAVWENSLARMGAALLPLAKELVQFATDVLPSVADGLTAVLNASAPLLSMFLTLAKLWLEHAKVIVPALAAVVGVKLVTAFANAATAAKLAGLAAKAAWAAAFLGLPLLLEGLESAGQAAHDFFTELTRGKEGAKVLAQLTEMVRNEKFADALFEWGVSVEDFTRVLEAADGDAEAAFRAIADNAGDVGKALTDLWATSDEAAAGMTAGWGPRGPVADAAEGLSRTVEGVLNGLPEAMRSRVEAALKNIRTFPGGVSTVLDDGTTIVAGSAADLAAAIPDALAAADERAMAIAREIPGDIAKSILEGRDAVVQAADDLADAATDPLVEQARIDEIRKKMGEAQKALTDAIRSGEAAAGSAAKAEYARLEIELAGHLLRADPKSKEAAGLLAKYFKSTDPATQTALKSLLDAVGIRYEVLERDVEQLAADTGMALPEALRLSRFQAETEARRTADAVARALAEAEDPAFTAGFKATDAFGDGMERGQRSVRDEADNTRSIVTGTFANARTWGYNAGSAWGSGLTSGISSHAGRLSTTLGGFKEIMEGSSPPRKGPLREIDKWGFNIGRAWAMGLAKGANAGDVLGALGGPGAALAGAGAAPPTPVPGGSGGTVVNHYYQLTSSGQVIASGSADDEVDAMRRLATFRVG